MAIQQVAWDCSDQIYAEVKRPFIGIPGRIYGGRNVSLPTAASSPLDTGLGRPNQLHPCYWTVALALGGQTSSVLTSGRGLQRPNYFKLYFWTLASGGQTSSVLTTGHWPREVKLAQFLPLDTGLWRSNQLRPYYWTVDTGLGRPNSLSPYYF